ncbi:MAG: FAD-dependent oxidoreductase, partial [Rhodospirillaceae bacterium]|nr:FAD-dependent oxidoreductase [Rhodospirillaceae bacterium]
MSIYEAPLNEHTPPWPYTVDYDKVNEVTTDVLIIGGGTAGCHAAINARKKGAEVLVIDKANVLTSGCGGSGVDHWHNACTNPASGISPEDQVDEFQNCRKGIATSEYGSRASHYITARESWDALLDVEEWGIDIRDVNDEFVGADFRDEETKLMFAYDYDSRTVVRVQGAYIKKAMHDEMCRLDVQIQNRVMITSLLTEGGKIGSRVIGATGFHIRTGEFYIFKAKSTIVCTGPATRLWVFSTELVGANSIHDDPNDVGDGNAICYNAGAEFGQMEAGGRTVGGFRYFGYGTGNAHNTWFACTIVDSNGKEVPWVDRDGKEITNVADRYRVAKGQKMFYHGPPPHPYETQGPTLTHDLADRIESGEFVLPFYADLPGMPELERKAIFGLMVGNEGKTRHGVYEPYTDGGYNPNKHMMQANVLPPEEAGIHKPWWNGQGPPQWRETAFGGGGGLVYDWDCRSTLEGLYTAGNQMLGGGNHSQSASTGRYAGRKAADYALRSNQVEVDQAQLNEERTRVYAPVKRSAGIGWKEFQAGLCRVMQDYCATYKAEETLKIGLEWLDSIKESEGQEVFARNPHELARIMEAFSRLTVGQMIMEASRARKASSKACDFERVDYPEVDPP